MANAIGQIALAVKVAAPPDKGAANAAVIKLLAKTVDVSKSSFRLTSGETARDKVLEVVQNAEAVAAYIKGLGL